MNIPEPIRDKVIGEQIEKNPISEQEKVKVEKIVVNDNKQEAKNKKRKVRMCSRKSACQFKNVWTHPDRCYAPFTIWHTCIHKGGERKL